MAIYDNQPVGCYRHRVYTNDTGISEPMVNLADYLDRYCLDLENGTWM